MAEQIDKKKIQFKNKISRIAFLVVFPIIFSIYLTGALMVVVMRDFGTFLHYLPMNILDQLTVLMQFVLNLWLYWNENKAVLSISSSDYFVLKLFVISFAPIIVTLMSIYIFRDKIKKFKLFKEPKSSAEAHWATPAEIKKAGLNAKKGVILGRYKKDFLVAGGYQHSLLFAPTGSGKGVGFVIPNLLFWKDSAIVHDIKLENYEKTSGWRKKELKQKVFVWNPADTDGISHCYNPLDWISDKPGKMVDDVQKIVHNLCTTDKEEFWTKEARSFLVGVVLYLLADETRITSIGEVVRILRGDDVVYSLAVVLDTMGKKIHPVAYMNIAAFLQKADKERSGVTSTANSFLELWANPIIDSATARSDFDLQRFKKEPHTVYVGVTPDNLHRLRPLLRVFYQQAASFFTMKLPQPDEKYGVLMMMDEFPSLGKMEQFQIGIAYFRGYNVRLFLIVQDTEQLKATYDAAGMNTFLSNCTYRITFAANNYDTAQLISNFLGEFTNYSMSSFGRPKYLDLNPGARTINIGKSRKKLLQPQEVINLPRDEQILLVEAHAPIKSKKIIFYKEKFFMERVLPKIDVPKQKPYVPGSFVPRKKKNPTAS